VEVLLLPFVSGALVVNAQVVWFGSVHVFLCFWFVRGRSPPERVPVFGVPGSVCFLRFDLFGRVVEIVPPRLRQRESSAANAK